MANQQYFVICIHNEDAPDLEVRKVYPVIPDKKGQEAGYLRVIDESGEDYLYPESCFNPIELSETAIQALRLTA